jgi:hypothetical protein
MPEVHSVFATVRLPSDGDPGQVTIGYYTLADGVLTMTDSKGRPVRTSSGEKRVHRLQEGEDPRSIASRLTKQIRMSMRGEADFNRRLVYPSVGIV